MKPKKKMSIIFLLIISLTLSFSSSVFASNDVEVLQVISCDNHSLELLKDTYYSSQVVDTWYEGLYQYDLIEEYEVEEYVVICTNCWVVQDQWTSENLIRRYIEKTQIWFEV